MIEQSVSLASNGVVKVPGYEQLVRFGYTKNRGVYRLHVDATGEWAGLTIRAFWHVPDGKDPVSSLVADGYVDVPASVTAQPGNGCITFEGSDGTRTVTSADLRYRISANSGTEDGTEPEPGTPAWQQLVDAVHADATAAEQAKTDAQTAAQTAQATPSIIWVQGEEGAKAYMVAAGNSVLLMDSENSAFYIKSTDASGMPLPLRVFDYKERTTATKMPPQTAQQPGGEFVTRAEFDALAARCAALEKQEPAKPETEVK